MPNTYRFSTQLCGYVQVAYDTGQYNNRSFAYVIPREVLVQIEADRKELLKWARTKSPSKRPHVNVPPWGKEGKARYSYGVSDGLRKPKPEPLWLGSNDKALDIEQLEALEAGTPIEIEIVQKPYSMGESNIGTTIRVEKVRCLELNGRGKYQREETLTDTATSKRRDTLLDPMERTVSDLVGSGVVYALQDMLDTYIPVVGNENRNALVELIRQEANDYLDQELMDSPSKSSLRTHIETLGV